MSKPIDINKATLEELTSITGIGEKRAQKILNKKQEKESDLTLQDLKLMTGIPSTIWDPLIETEEIMIELPSNAEGGQTHQTQPIDQNVIQKMANTIDILTNELDTLQQDKSNMKSTYDQQIQYLTVDFKTKMKNKEHEYEQQIREYKKQQKEQFEAFVADSKEIGNTIYSMRLCYATWN
jgi:ribosomal protein S13